MLSSRSSRITGNWWTCWWPSMKAGGRPKFASKASNCAAIVEATSSGGKRRV